MLNSLRRLLAYLLSFRKSVWTLEDYPITIKKIPRLSDHNLNDGEENSIWRAETLGWRFMGGQGHDRVTALQHLRERFSEFCKSGEDAPRPGTLRLPKFELASTARIDELEDLAPKFFREVIGMSYGNCLITDESSLWDFPHENAEDVYTKIQQVYSIDVHDIESGNLADIFERIRILSSSAYDD
jgi:hypothetical protein